MKLTAVILPPAPAAFRVVAGLPVIVRLVLTALRSGAARVVALAGEEPERLRALLAGDPRTAGVALSGGEPPHLADSETVALLPSDVLFTPAALADVFAAADPTRALLVRPAAASADDAAIVVGPARLVMPLRDALAGPAPALSLAARAVDAGWCMRIRDRADAAAAERRLLSDLRAASAETDGPIARFDRALSTRLSRLLVRTPLRPNHITVAGTAVGLWAAWSLAAGTYGGGLLGAFLFWLAVIIDGCDGEVARLKMQETRFGYLFDVTTDNLVHAAIFLGIGVGQYRAAPSQSYALLGALLLTGLAFSLLASYVCLIRHPPVCRMEVRSSRGRMRKRLLQGFEAVMNRDFAYLLLPLAVVGRLHWFLWGAAFGSHAFAGALFLVYRWRDEE